MKSIYKSFLIMAVMSVGFISCDDEDYFELDRYQDLISEAFPVDNVDSSHDWKTVGTVTAQISVNSIEPCTVKIYANNPFTSGNGTLLMQEKVNGAETIKSQFSCPLSTTMVYVALVDAKGYTYLKPAKISGGLLSTSVGTLLSSSPQRRSMQIAEVPHTTLNINPDDYLNGATEVNAENSVCNREGDANYVLKMKITGEWNGNIAVLPSEPPYSRTVYVSGKWTLDSQEQRAGGGSVIIVASGGEIVIPDGGLLNCVNEGRVVVMPGGKITGAGQLAFPNGSGDNYSYNGGTIDIGVLNNNGGTVYNYGTMNIGGLCGGAVNSTYINHGTVKIDHSIEGSGSSNTRVKNGCWWECTNKFEAKIIEMAQTSYLKAGSMKVSVSEDNTSDPSYITMSSNSMIDVTGATWLNFVTITGPAEGDYAILQLGSVAQCNYSGGWSNDPVTVGYVSNNIYLSVDSEEDIDNPDVTYNQYNPSPYTTLTTLMLNGALGTVQQGNGNAKLVSKGATDIHIDASECTAGYEGTDFDIDDEPFSMRFCFEDNFPMEGDYDFNDAVITVTPEISNNVVKLTVSLDAVGATEQIAAALRIAGVQQWELQSISVSGDFDYAERPISSAQIINTQEYILPYHMNMSGNLVINLFNDAHLVMARQAEKQGLGEAMMPNGNVRRWFYNTVERTDGLAEKLNDVTPVKVVYTLTMNSTEAAQRFVADNFDAFIVEGYNGGYWEVHTYPYKTAQVLTDYAYKDMTPYDDNYPWAVQVPGSFKYPKEWTSIGASKTNILSGAYQTAGHSFGEWARDKSKATDWYNYPTAGLIYQ